MGQSFETLFKRVYEKGEDLKYQEKPVSMRWVKELERGLPSGENVPLFVFCPKPLGYFEYEASVDHVEVDGDTTAYSVDVIGKDTPELLEFVLVEGPWVYGGGKLPKSVRYISFWVEVETVEPELTS